MLYWWGEEALLIIVFYYFFFIILWPPPPRGYCFVFISTNCIMRLFWLLLFIICFLLLLLFQSLSSSSLSLSESALSPFKVHKCSEVCCFQPLMLCVWHVFFPKLWWCVLQSFDCLCWASFSFKYFWLNFRKSCLSTIIMSMCTLGYMAWLWYGTWSTIIAIKGETKVRQPTISQRKRSTTEKTTKNIPALHQSPAQHLSNGFLVLWRKWTVLVSGDWKLSSLVYATLGIYHLQGNSPSCTYDHSQFNVLEGPFLPEGG